MKLRFLSISLIFLVVFIGCIFIWQMIYLPKSPGFQQTLNFSIMKGQGSKEISIALERQGIIKSGFIFRMYVLARGAAKKLQAGEYSLSSGMSIPEIVDKLVLGQILKEKITIIEGWNLKDIGQYFEEKGICSSEDFLKLVTQENFSQDFACPCGDFLKDKPKNLGLEGYLFPDTYEISASEKLEDIVRKILVNFDRKLTGGLRTEIKSQDKTIFEIMTMASLIEKEVNTLEDKKIVSGIFWKRLKIGKPLESCATIAYILGVNKWRYSFDDTRIKSPYNTYLNRGLPLGPICNPGMESIIATIYPEESDYWYYLSTKEGKTIFSRTIEEHNIAKAKYQQ